jgi:hypothetical protein
MAWKVQQSGLYSMPSQPERRKRSRSHVHWQVCFFGVDVGRTVETTTDNLSSAGFHCFSPVPLIAGDLVTCRLCVPSRRPADNGRGSSLECKVRVVRVEPASERQSYGVACEIEDYRFIKSNYLLYL